MTFGIEIDGTTALLAGALVLGVRHGFDWDHIIAISDITSTAVASESLGLRDRRGQPVTSDDGRALANGTVTPRPAAGTKSWLPPRHAVALGTLYALGHASVVATLGLAALSLGAMLPTWVDPVMGRVVGVTLLALGGWLLLSVYRTLRHGQEFRLRSRWMLVLDGARTLRARILGRPTNPHRHQVTSSYGAGTSYGIGMIHGIGAETATQVLLITALGGATGQGLGIPLMLAFIVGLVLANTVIVGLSASGFAGVGDRRRLNLVLGVVAAFASIAVGILFITGWETALPDLTEMLGGTIDG